MSNQAKIGCTRMQAHREDTNDPIPRMKEAIAMVVSIVSHGHIIVAYRAYAHGVCFIPGEKVKGGTCLLLRVHHTTGDGVWQHQAVSWLICSSCIVFVSHCSPEE